jgi:LmbE family N-acetylglucosaminyl deacetylase
MLGPMATVVAFHAHPDDEVLLTGGTLARAAAEGHRVVIVVACDGIMTAASEAPPTRLNELRASAAILGVQRVEHLGYADSGHGPILYPDPPDRQRFVRADTGEAAERLATILREEMADVLLSYDRNGGYGHRDHRKVHEVGKRAAELAGVDTVLEATMPREVVERLVRWMCALRIPFRCDPDALRAAYSPGSAITHRVNVRRFARQKQTALAAHRSQVNRRGGAAPIMRLLVRLPAPIFGVFLGREWFIDPAQTPVTKPASSMIPNEPTTRPLRTRGRGASKSASCRRVRRAGLGDLIPRWAGLRHATRRPDATEPLLVPAPGVGGSRVGLSCPPTDRQ